MRVQTLTLKPHGEDTHTRPPTKTISRDVSAFWGHAASIFTERRFPSKPHGVVCQKAVNFIVTAAIARNVTEL
jgi:hypothetical protein